VSVQFLCWLVAFVLLLISAFWSPPRASLLSLGLAALTLGFLVPAIHP